MDLRMYWIVRNGAFAAALYFAMVEHVGWLMYAIGAFAWWQLASSAWAMADPATPPAPAENSRAIRQQDGFRRRGARVAVRRALALDGVRVCDVVRLLGDDPGARDQQVLTARPLQLRLRATSNTFLPMMRLKARSSPRLTGNT